LKAGDRVLCATWPLATHLVGGPCPVSIAAHGSDLTRPPSGPGREATLSAAAALYPVSHFLGAQLRRPYTVLPYPIRPQAQARRGEAILCIARLGPLKGVDRVLRLGARLGRPVVVVGEGPERPALERLAGELGVEAHFHGELAPEQIPWDGTWALALFSRTAEDGSGGEGLGLVLLEAASRGIPTLGSAVGGIPEAASVVLHDPETDPIPPLPTADSVQAWLEATHGPTAMRNVLKP
jgi:glycosyltransferase involved in cell wall biosynthesis